jgi:hypothetical protein
MLLLRSFIIYSNQTSRSTIYSQVGARCNISSQTTRKKVNQQ